MPSSRHGKRAVLGQRRAGFCPPTQRSGLKLGLFLSQAESGFQISPWARVRGCQLRSGSSTSHLPVDANNDGHYLTEFLS